MFSCRASNRMFNCTEVRINEKNHNNSHIGQKRKRPPLWQNRIRRSDRRPDRSREIGTPSRTGYPGRRRPNERWRHSSPPRQSPSAWPLDPASFFPRGRTTHRQPWATAAGTTRSRQPPRRLPPAEMREGPRRHPPSRRPWTSSAYASSPAMARTISSSSSPPYRAINQIASINSTNSSSISQPQSDAESP